MDEIATPRPMPTAITILLSVLLIDMTGKVGFEQMHGRMKKLL
jgi:hypothetical protein